MSNQKAEDKKKADARLRTSIHQLERGPMVSLYLKIVPMDTSMSKFALIHHCIITRSTGFCWRKTHPKTTAHNSPVRVSGRPLPFSAERGALPSLIAAMCSMRVRHAGAYTVSASFEMVSTATPRACRATARRAVCSSTSADTPVPAYLLALAGSRASLHFPTCE